MARFASILDNRTATADAALTLARDILPAWVSRALGRPLSRLSRLGHRSGFHPASAASSLRRGPTRAHRPEARCPVEDTCRAVAAAVSNPSA